MKRLTSIQALRGILFLFVLAFHCGVPYANFGWGGVEVFFVVSSFFLTRKLLDDSRVRVKKQFMHRIRRLYPPYMLVLFIGIAWAVMHRRIPYDFVSHMLSIQNFQWMVTGYSSSMQAMTAHTWTLSIEMWLGFLWLLFLKYYSGRNFKRCVFLMGLLSIIYRIATILGGCNVYVISLCPLAHMDAFALGTLIAIKTKEFDEGANCKLRRFSLVLVISGLVGIILTIALLSFQNGITLLGGYQLLGSPINYLNHVITGNIYLYLSVLSSGIIGILYMYDNMGGTHGNWCYRTLEWIGDKSYVLYLFHWPFVVVCKALFGRWYISFLVCGVVSVLLEIVYSGFSRKIYKVFETR